MSLSNNGTPAAQQKAQHRWRAETRQMNFADLLELVTDVQLVRVKQQQDEVASGSEPAAHVDEVVGALYALLLA